MTGSNSSLRTAPLRNCDGPIEMLSHVRNRGNPVSNCHHSSTSFHSFLGALSASVPRCHRRRQLFCQPPSGLGIHWTRGRPSPRAKKLGVGFLSTLNEFFWCGGFSTLPRFFFEWCRLSITATGVELHVRLCGPQKGRISRFLPTF